MSLSSHLRQNNSRSKQRWVKAHPPKVRKTTHTTFAVEDAEEGPITYDTKHVQPVDLAEEPNYVSSIGHTRKFTALVFVADSF